MLGVKKDTIIVMSDIGQTSVDKLGEQLISKVQKTTTNYEAYTVKVSEEQKIQDQEIKAPEKKLASRVSEKTSRASEKTSTNTEIATESDSEISPVNKLQKQIEAQQRTLDDIIKQIAQILPNISIQLKTSPVVLHLNKDLLQFAIVEDKEHEYREKYQQLKQSQEKIQQAITGNSKTDKIISATQQKVIKDAESLLKATSNDLQTVTNINIIQKQIEEQQTKLAETKKEIVNTIIAIKEQLNGFQRTTIQQSEELQTVTDKVGYYGHSKGREYQKEYLKLRQAQEKIQKAITDGPQTIDAIAKKQQEVIKGAESLLKAIKQDLQTVDDLLQQKQIEEQQTKLAEIRKQIILTGNLLSEKLKLTRGTKQNLSQEDAEKLNTIQAKLLKSEISAKPVVYQEQYTKLNQAQEKIQQAITDNSKTDKIISATQQKVIKDAESLLKAMKQDLQTVDDLLQQEQIQEQQKKLAEIRKQIVSTIGNIRQAISQLPKTIETSPYSKNVADYSSRYREIKLADNSLQLVIDSEPRAAYEISEQQQEELQKTIALQQETEKYLQTVTALTAKPKAQ